jgi:hypothetical protein
MTFSFKGLATRSSHTRSQSSPLRGLNLVPSERSSRIPRVWKVSLVAALRGPEDLLSPAWPGVAGAEHAGGGGKVCLVSPCLALWWHFRDPESLRRHPRQSFRFSHLLFISKHTPLTRQLHLRNNGNLDNFPKSVIMSFRIVSFSFLKIYFGFLLKFWSQSGKNKLLIKNCYAVSNTDVVIKSSSKKCYSYQLPNQVF